MATFLTADDPIFLTPRQQQVAELLGTRRRQIREAEEHARLLGEYGWAARALVRSQISASGRPQETGAWRRQAVTASRVWRQHTESQPVEVLVALGAIQDALDELHAREVVERQTKLRDDSPSMYVWVAPWLP